MEVDQHAADPRALRAAVPAPAEPRSEADQDARRPGDLRDRDALRRPVLADGARAWTDRGVAALAEPGDAVRDWRRIHWPLPLAARHASAAAAGRTGAGRGNRTRAG